MNGKFSEEELNELEQFRKRREFFFNLNQKSKRSKCIRKEFQTQSEAKKFLSENQKKHHSAEIFELEKMRKN